jgi:hypothetical protein
MRCRAHCNNPASFLRACIACQILCRRNLDPGIYPTSPYTPAEQLRNINRLYLPYQRSLIGPDSSTFAEIVHPSICSSYRSELNRHADIHIGSADTVTSPHNN